MFVRARAVVVAAGLVGVLGGCGAGADGGAGAGASGGGRAGSPPAKGAPAELVEWMGAMCGSAESLAGLREESRAEMRRIRKPAGDDPSARVLAAAYLMRVPADVREEEQGMRDLGPSGVPSADRLRGAWLRKLKGAVASLEDVSPVDATGADAPGGAAEVDGVVQSLTPPEPGLPALAKEDRVLGAAYREAERCGAGGKGGGRPDGSAPPASSPSSSASPSAGRLPKAADGRNLGACGDGECEVLVTAPVRITANGLTVNVSVTDDTVTFMTPDTVMQLGGEGGEAGFGDDLKAVVVGLDEDGAVLRFSTP